MSHSGFDGGCRFGSPEGDPEVCFCSAWICSSEESNISAIAQLPDTSCQGVRQVSQPGESYEDSSVRL